MKNKLLLVLFALTISMTALADDIWAKATAISIKHEGGKYSAWEPVDIDVYLNIDKKQIIVYSKETQVFDYVTETITNRDGYRIMKMQATDTKYRVCNLVVLLSNTSWFLYIEYSDVIYGYSLK